MARLTKEQLQEQAAARKELKATLKAPARGDMERETDGGYALKSRWI